MEKQQHRLQEEQRKDPFEVLYLIPKNMLYIFFFVILGAYLAMLYIVLGGRGMAQFLEQTPGTALDFKVHPLFSCMQEYLSNQSDLNAEIPILSMEDISQQQFYSEYLTKSIPFVVQDGTKNWPNLENWKNKRYLQKLYGDAVLEILKIDFGHLPREYVSEMAESGDEKFQHLLESVQGKPKRSATVETVQMTFQEYMQETKGLSHQNSHRYKYYIVGQGISGKMILDFSEPDIFQNLLPLMGVSLTIWGNFTRQPHFIDRERYLCVIQGQEKIRLVSPIYKHNVYAGVFEEFSIEESPLDFFNTDLDQFPLFKDVPVKEILIQEGHCLFIPALFFVQSDTISRGYHEDESILLNFDYEPHSQLLMMLFQAIDSGLLIDD